MIHIEKCANHWVFMLLVSTLLFCMISPVSAGDTSITRSMPSSVHSSENFDIQLDISDLEVGGIVETLPEGFSYAGSSLPEERIETSGQNVIISVIGDESVTYKVKASSRGSGTFEGIWYDCLNEVEGTIEGSDIQIRSRSDSGGDDSRSSSTSTPLSSGVKPVPTTDKDNLSFSSDGLLERSVVVTSDDHMAYIKLAKGVNATDATGEKLGDIGIKSLKSGEIPPSGHDGEFSLNGHAYECSPTGATFSPAIDLVFNLSEDDWKADAGKGFSVRWFNTEKLSWEDIETTVDQKNRTVTAHITHFSIFALFERAVAVVDEKEDTPLKAPEVRETSVTTSTQENMAGDNTEESGAGFIPLIAGILALLLIGGCGLYLYNSRNEKEKTDKK